LKFELKRLEPVYIEICGQEYPARLTNKAVKEILELWKVEYFEMFDRFASEGLKTDEIHDILYIVLKCGGVEIEREVFEELDHDPLFISSATAKILELFDRTQKVESVLEEEKDPEDDKKKPKAAE